MMNVLISTAIRENYGAHDWDGAGECPQMWKYKGGEDYIIVGAPSVEDAEHFVEYRVCSESEYSSEEVISATEVDEGVRTEKEIYSYELAPVRFDWTERFLSKRCRGGWKKNTTATYVCQITQTTGATVSKNCPSQTGNTRA